MSEWFREGSNLVEHAEQQLNEAGMFDSDSDYGGALGDVVMKMVKEFASYGHSGMSAEITRELFNRLVQFEDL